MKPIGVLTTVLSILLFAFDAYAAAEDVFRGKALRIIVGFAAGGGFDTYSRTIARHLGRHIPGNPTVVVENMTGAGGLISANYVYKIAKPDGLTLGNLQIGPLIIAQILKRPGVEYDALRFEPVGVVVKDNPVCTFTKASGVTDVEKWLTSKTPVKVGGIAPGSVVYDHVRILQATLGFPIQLVSGYKGTADIRLAAEAGEVAGGCWTWESIKATWRKAIDSGEAVPVLQLMPKPLPDLPRVPLAIDFAQTDEARQLIQAGVHDISNMIFSYGYPPGTSKDLVQTLRKSFINTMLDREFLADAKRSNLNIGPMKGEELETTVARLFQLPSSVITRLREVLAEK
jgi:tripartite-type tricarboxylate transporter receptor subunit TctC